MSDRNVDIARRAFEAFGARDIEALLPLLDPDIEFLPVTAMIAAGGEPYRGHEGMRRYFVDVDLVWDELRLNPRDFSEHGEYVVVVGRVYAHGQGRVVDSPAGWVWRFRDGRIVWAKVFPDPADALVYAGAAV